jgi:CRISPR-associated protein Cas5t
MNTESLPNSLPSFYFDIHAELAHFRDIFTQSFFKTLLAPPRTTIIGMLGAALGLDESDTISLSDKLLVGSKILHLKGYAKEITTAVNLKRDGGRTPVMRNLVVEPHYRIFVGSQDKGLILRLHDAIRAPIFSLYLGISECLASLANTSEVTNATLVKAKLFKCTVPLSSNVEYNTKVEEKGKTIFLPERARTVHSFVLLPNGRMPASYVNLLMFYNCAVELSKSLTAYDFREPVCMI